MDTPTEAPCRICGAIICQDCSGQPVSAIYPNPVICSRDCFSKYMTYLCSPENRAKIRLEEAPGT